MLYQILSPLLKSVRLHLDQKQIALTWELLGLKFHRVGPVPTKNITKLVYEPKTFTTDSHGNRVKVPPQLIIWAGVHKYELVAGDSVKYTEPELEWLANELSYWLSLPITRR